jgi:hypothetical protein
MGKIESRLVGISRRKSGARFEAEPRRRVLSAHGSAAQGSGGERTRREALNAGRPSLSRHVQKSTQAGQESPPDPVAGKVADDDEVAVRGS